MNLTHHAHQWITDRIDAQPISERSCAVDATCGNGHDTRFLLSLGFSKVFGFDTQAAAIEATRARCLNQSGFDRLTLLEQSHHTLNVVLSEYDIEHIDCAMFNLGYLPGADKKVTTLTRTSCNALSQVLNRLTPKAGIMTVMAYPGHEEGASEATAVEVLLEKWQATSTCHVERYDSANPSPLSPILYCVRKL